MGKYSLPDRDSSLSRQLFDVYSRYLGDSLDAIIVCGGAGRPSAQTYEGSDIDYVVVVSELNPDNLISLAFSQDELAKSHVARPSPTVITSYELANLPKLFLELDGKAVQALIEARGQDTAGIEMSAIPSLSSEQIAQFSRHNFFILQALLRKAVVRSNSEITTDARVTIAKIALIVNKMHSQALGIDVRKMWEGRSVLEKLKLHPEEFTDQAVREVVVATLRLRVN